MKQTATQYLYDQFMTLFGHYLEEKIDSTQFIDKLVDARVKSYFMEKEQVMNAYIEGDEKPNPLGYTGAEEYYSANYKQ